MPRSADVVVIGGGVMGASCAYHLLRAGVRRVVLLEREGSFGTGATGRCAGGVRYQFATEINIRLSIASLPRFETFLEETGQDCDYRPCGYMIVLTRQEDVEAFRRSRDLQNRLGVQTKWLTADEVRRRLPDMHWPDALGATFHERDGLVDPNSVVMGYVQRGRQLGLTAVTDQPVIGIEVDGGRVRGVVTPGGRIECGDVVDAAGPWAAVVGEMAGVRVPITPVRRQMVTTTPLPDLPKDFPFVIDFAQSLYFHREGEGILTGMSNPHEVPGFDQSIDRQWEAFALEAAASRLPMLESAGRLSGWAGLYEVTPDAHPIFGATPVDGFWIVAGFSGHGFMHGPVAGQLMAEVVTRGRFVTVDVSSLDLARFDEGRLIHEYNVV
ncbi:MAG TPA: FAD-dependent oxidoreductase [Anaerolineales bacterium]|nr:FAD-dependent oxidoreductase [Anaerolineales bacterium]